MFKNAKIGDRVFNYLDQRWETVTDIYKNKTYSIITDKNGYTYEGKEFIEDKLPILFWDEVKPITPPEKPLPKLEVDTKVLVWSKNSRKKRKRHFAYFNNYEEIRCYDNGLSSWTASPEQTSVWDNWKLA